jgi:hypothetical protein
MELVNKIVMHERFGRGSVVEYNDAYIKINFALGDKRFVFPDAFGKYLTLIDQKAANLVSKMIQKKEKESRIKDLELKKLKIKQHEERRLILERERIVRNSKNRSIHPSLQVVFWCKQEDRDRVFTDWNIFTGAIKSGNKKGEPNRLVRMNQNSTCLLTAREPDVPEENRRIIGIFMVREAFSGRLCKDGYIPAHPEYRLRLSEEESEKMLFWNYYVNKKYPHRITWNTGRSRYFDNILTAQILRDLASLKKESQERERVEGFFNHFCQMNRIKEEELPKPDGALMRI